ncbi:MAG: exonuclease SbcCD subunit D C-terminal domain-containing protein [Microthrixaceae bacterium]
MRSTGSTTWPSDISMGPRRSPTAAVAYSGSPLPYSFSEERHHKSVSIVELGPDGAATVDRVRLDVGMNVRSITGRLDELVSDRSHTEAETAWVRATLTDTELPHQAMARLKRRFPAWSSCVIAPKVACSMSRRPAPGVTAATSRRSN